MSNYFKQIPDFEYVSRLPDAKISDYITVKNLFKKGELRPDIFQDLATFQKYQIKGDDRPDNVAQDFYQDSSLDWLVLTCNNVVNIQTEWPLTQRDFDRFLLDKYGTYADLESIHHYETVELKNSKGVVMLEKGLEVENDFSFSYYDWWLKEQKTIISANAVTSVTNYQYEEKIEDDKRNIFLLKTRYLGLVMDDMEDMMTYKKGSTQYVDETLKKAENIRLYQ
tara:strand:+ start:1686 stop:2357 length:672 start_codon:yes stop_codon:yes gene_type:complete